LFETEIKDAIQDILADETKEAALQHLAITLAIGDYRVRNGCF